MPGGNKRTNIFLLLISILLCFGCGYLFRQSTAIPSKLQNDTIQLFAAKENDEEPSHKKETPEETPVVHQQQLLQCHLLYMRYPQKPPQVSGHPAEATGCLWSMGLLTKDGLLIQMEKDTFSIRMESCRLVG